MENMENEGKRKLSIQAGVICLLRDREGMLDAYDEVRLNTGDLVVTPALHRKLAEKGARINAGTLRLRDITGPITLFERDAVIDGTVDYQNGFIVAAGSVIIRPEGMERLRNIEGAMVLGDFFYPAPAPDSPEPDAAPGSSPAAGAAEAGWLARCEVGGAKRAYPAGAWALLGDRTVAGLLNETPEGAASAWTPGQVTALDQTALDQAAARGLRVACGSLFTYQGLNDAYGHLFTCLDRVLVPDGYEILQGVSSRDFVCYGPRLYIRGDITVTGEGALKRLEGIIVEGQANLDLQAAAVFREIGKAARCVVMEESRDSGVKAVNGQERFTHARLAAFKARGLKFGLEVNGHARFDPDVIPEDLDCITWLEVNGSVEATPEVQAALWEKVQEVNGIITGLSGREDGPSREDPDGGLVRINTGNFFLV